MSIANLAGLDLYYEIHGNGEPVLLVSPSWWSCDTWNVQVVPILSKSFKTVLHECRGAGRSSRPDHGYNVTQFAKDAFGLLEHLNISRCHLVGFALGGQIAQAMAIASPQLVATLTMAATGPGSKNLSGSSRTAEDSNEQIQQMGFEHFIRSHADNDTVAFSSSFFREHHDVVRALGEALWQRQAEPEFFHDHEAARRTWDTLANAASLKVPTLILVGGDDNASRGASTPLATAQQLAELVPGAELAVIPGVKHMTFWDGTAAVKRLMNFLSRHPL